MIARRGCISVGMLLACSGAAGCGRSEPAVLTDVRPAFSYVPNGENCVFGGDWSEDVTFERDDCQLADAGFTDQVARFQFTDPNVVFEAPNYPQAVYFVHEERFTSAGAGYRIADAKFYTTEPVQTNEFDLTLFAELTGSVFVAFAGACPSSYTESVACAEFAFANESHDEPRLCIWNETLGQGGSASAYCSLLMGPGFATNRLPTASFSASELSRTTSSATWRFNASASTDPEAGALTYYWQFDGGSVQSTGDPVYDNTFTTSGQHLVRLRVADASGGMDVQLQSIVAVFASPLTITSPATLPAGRVNQAYSYMLQASGGSGSYSWNLTAGTLPPGLTLSSGGALSGTPTSADNYAFTARVEDGTGSASKDFNLVINPASPLSVGFELEPSPVKPKKWCDWSANAWGGSAPYTYSWYRGGVFIGNGRQINAYTSASSFWMRVKVQDTLGQSVWDSTYVSVTSSSPSDCTY